jgi:hypothetical protein
MPYQVHDAVLHAMSGTELSRVRTELRLLPPEPISQRLLESRGADIVMQSNGVPLPDLSSYRRELGICPADRRSASSFPFSSRQLQRT